MNLLIWVPAFLRVEGFNKSQRRVLTVKRKIPAYTISIWDFGSICKRYREIIPKVIVKFGAGDTVKDIVRNFCKEKKEYLRFSHPF